jgi:hypothetical protein
MGLMRLCELREVPFTEGTLDARATGPLVALRVHTPRTGARTRVCGFKASATAWQACLHTATGTLGDQYWPSPDSAPGSLRTGWMGNGALDRDPQQLGAHRPSRKSAHQKRALHHTTRNEKTAPEPEPPESTDASDANGRGGQGNPAEQPEEEQHDATARNQSTRQSVSSITAAAQPDSCPCPSCEASASARAPAPAARQPPRRANDTRASRTRRTPPTNARNAVPVPGT